MARPPIPDPVKRLVRQRCGFGCVVCGLPLYDYDHMVPYSDVQEHEAENMVLLCPQHHREKTSGLLPPADVATASADPWNRRSGVSTPQDLRYSGNQCEVALGSVRHVWPLITHGDYMVSLIVDDTPLIMFRAEDEQLLLTVQLFDAANEMLVQIVDNELVFSAAPWDVEFVGRRLTVRARPREIFVQMSFEPPGRILVDRARIWRNGIGVAVSPKVVVTVNDGVGAMDFLLTRGVVGVGFGDVPDELENGLVFEGVSRKPLPPGPAATEASVFRFVRRGVAGSAPYGGGRR